jgi:endonuclease/exonuclease/phosphatase family metal-dependent hydrolase
VHALRLRSAVLLVLCCACIAPLWGSPIRVTTWNLQWFPNGSPREKSARTKAKTVNKAAEVIRALNPDILLLQEVKDYDTC